MRVKRYVVDALPDAVPLIRNELGKDAVILESKEIKVGGVLGMFRKRKIEVLAAVEPNAAKQEPKSNKKLDAEQVDLVIEQILKASQRSKVQDNKEPASTKTTQNEQPAAAPQAKEPLASATGASFASRLYQASPTNQAMQANQASSPSPTKAASEQQIKAKPAEQALSVDAALSTSAAMSPTEQFIVNELQSLRQEMIRLAKNRNAEYVPSESIAALRNRLVEQELDQHWIDIVYDDFVQLEQETGESLTAAELWQQARAKLIEWLTPYKGGKLDLSTQFVQFVGPTGVGKTTTIAKLAANYSIKEHKQLGLITADTYRIAAVEQLRTYANILNIPLEVVFSPLEMERALTALEDADLILMDTAGRNYKSDLHVSEVNSLLPHSEQSESVLVLSLTSRTADMKVIAEKFSKYGVRKVVFTKIDETSSYGTIFNMIMLYGLTPLFITSGQNVPDDIESFQLEKYIDMLLGEPHHV